MTYLKMNNKPSSKTFNNFMDDLFATVPSFIQEDYLNAKKSVAVNIKETETDYLLEVVAPGFEKEDFKINVDKNLLTIEGERKREEENKTQKQIKREYNYQSFKRSFSVDDKVDAENI